MHRCRWGLALRVHLQEQCRQIRQEEDGRLLRATDEGSKAIQAKRNPRAWKAASQQKLGKDRKSREEILLSERSLSGERASGVREVRAREVSLLGVRIGAKAEPAKEKRKEDEHRTI